MRIRLSIPKRALTREALEAAAEATTLTNEALLKSGKYPTARQAIRKGVRWQPEPPGDEHFDIIPTVLGRKWGDCDDLAPYHAASLRVTGKDPEARVIVRKSGPRRWHALVERGNGRTEDPSVWAGMPTKAKGPRYAPTAEPLVVGGVPDGRLAVHTAPFQGQRFARVDIPHIIDCQQALASCAKAPTTRAALLEALRGARLMGESIGCGPDTMNRINGAELALGAGTAGDLMRIMRGLDYVSPQLADDVIGFMGPILDIAKGAAGGALSKILPGGGAPAPAGGGGGGAPGGGGGGGFPGGASRGRGRGRGRAKSKSKAASNNWMINTPPPIIVRY